MNREGIFKTLFFYRAPVLPVKWNCLLVEVKEAPCIESFNARLTVVTFYLHILNKQKPSILTLLIILWTIFY